MTTIRGTSLYTTRLPFEALSCMHMLTCIPHADHLMPAYHSLTSTRIHSLTSTRIHTLATALF